MLDKISRSKTVYFSKILKDIVTNKANGMFKLLHKHAFMRRSRVMPNMLSTLTNCIASISHHRHHIHFCRIKPSPSGTKSINETKRR